MQTLLTSETRKARKDHWCNACDWLLNVSGDVEYLKSELGISDDEVASIEAAHANGWHVKKGDSYLYQTGVQDGEMVTFKAIPKIDGICHKYALYPEY